MNAKIAPDLTQKLETLPERPGVYIYHSSDRTVIYVGKAVVLRNRVRSYFQANRDPKTLTPGERDRRPGVDRH